MTHHNHGATVLGRILPRGVVLMSDDPVTVTPPSEDVERPHIRLHREANVVTMIDVLCNCGETVRLVCDYQPTSATSVQAAEK